MPRSLIFASRAISQPCTAEAQLSWHHPAVFLLIFVSLLIYIIVALRIRMKATIHIALSDESSIARRRAKHGGCLEYYRCDPSARNHVR